MKGVQTRSQQMMQLALKLVSSVPEEVEKKEYKPHADRIRQIYGSRCHDFPVLVRSCGLSQAIAFYADKANDEDKAMAKAHQLLLQHIGAIIGVETDGRGGADDLLLHQVLKADATEYMLYTRRILRSWVYFRRFAVSILKVRTAEVERR